MPAAPPDLGASIWAALEDSDAMLLSAFGDGEVHGDARARVTRSAMRGGQAELQANARLGAQLRESSAADVDLWSAIGASIGASDIEAEPDIAAELNEAVRALPTIDVAAQVMSRVTPRERSMPRWASIGAPLLALAMAAMVLLAVIPNLEMPAGKAGSASLAQVAAPFVMSAVNDAQVEDLETASDVVAQVVQFDDGGPTFILVDESGSTGGTL